MHELCELVVVDHGDGVFVGEHVGDLRAREGGVEVQRARPQLGERDRHLDEEAVVAAHDRHGVLFGDARPGQLVRERVRATVQLRERERATVVDQRGTVGIANRGARVGGRRRRAPALQSGQ